tara:strand:+ start:157 stop:1005 length:849 start_codon:yes stop_codon:yes gene_type:complete
MKLLLIILIFNQLVFSIGLEALNIPSSASSASISGAGIADSEDIWINPASIYNVKDRSIRFSTYNWLGSIPGNEMSIFWFKNKPHYISLQSSKIDDLELYGEIPQDKPLGTFSTSWIAASYASGFKISGFEIGSLMKINFSKLYNEMIYGYTTDIGMLYQFANSINFGFNIKNLGYEYSKNLRTSLPIQLGFGVSYIEPILKSVFVLDLINDKNNGTILKWGLYKKSDSIKYKIGFSKQNEIFMYGLGASYRFQQWGLNIGILSHNSTVFDISKYLDLIWYF